jgi:hypothetical protein
MDENQRVERKAGMMPVADIETGPIASRLRSRKVTMAPDEQGEMVIAIEGRTDSADTLRSLTTRQHQERQEDEVREDTLIERIQGAQQGGEQLLDVNQLPGMEAAEEIDEYPYWQPACDDQREAEQEAVAFWAKYIDARETPLREMEEICAHMAYREGCGEYAAIEIFPEDRFILQANKARVTRTADNPSIYMVEKAGRGSPLWVRWEKALLKEYNGITEKDAWEDATQAEVQEHGFTPHVTTLTVKRATNEDKARITTNGKAEKAKGIFPGKEFLFTPAMDEVILRFMGAIKAYFNLKRLRRSDVSQCFQYNRMADARLPRTVIVNLRPIEWGGYHRRAKKMLAVGYGMADAGREWFITIVAFLVDQGFVQCPEAECMFVKRVGTQGFILIGLATDDIQHLATDDELTQAADRDLECELSKQWQMVHEDAHDVLGVTIVTSEDGTVTMRQGPQLRKIQEYFYPKGEGPMVLAPGRRESTTVGPEGSTYKVTDRDAYMKGLGILGYIRITRPDVRAALSIRGETMQCPTEQDDRELRWIAAYVLTTADVGLTFHPGPRGRDTTGPIPVSGSSDASWSTSKTGQSRLGWMLRLGARREDQQEPISAPVIVSSKREQSTVSSSTLVSELHAAVGLTEANDRLRGMTRHLTGGTEESDGGITIAETSITDAAIREAIPHPPTEIEQDNRSLYTVVHHSVCGPLKKLKSVVRYLNIVKQSMQDGKTDMVWVPRTKQQSDKLTKAEISPTENWQWAEYVLGSSAAVRKYQKRAAEMKTQRQAQGTMICYQVEEDTRVPMQSTPIPMEVVAQSAIEQEQEQEQLMAQGLEDGGLTTEQERGEKQRGDEARENKMRNAVLKFNRKEVLGRKHEYFRELIYKEREEEQGVV